MHKTKRSLTDLIILVLFVISGIWSSCFAQKDTKLDSFLLELQKVQDDTNKVNTLNALSNHLYNKSKDTDAKKYAEYALLLAEKNQFSKGIANSCKTSEFSIINKEITPML